MLNKWPLIGGVAMTFAREEVRQIFFSTSFNSTIILFFFFFKIKKSKLPFPSLSTFFHLFLHLGQFNESRDSIL